MINYGLAVGRKKKRNKKKKNHFKKIHNQHEAIPVEELSREEIACGIDSSSKGLKQRAEGLLEAICDVTRI